MDPCKCIRGFHHCWRPVDRPPFPVLRNRGRAARHLDIFWSQVCINAQARQPVFPESGTIKCLPRTFLPLMQQDKRLYKMKDKQQCYWRFKQEKYYSHSTNITPGIQLSKKTARGKINIITMNGFQASRESEEDTNMENRGKK